MSEPLADESFMRARLFGGDKSNAVILDGVPIGEMAGAGTVVTRDLASQSIAAGVPARVPHLEPEEPVEDAGFETLLTYRSGRV